MLSERIARAISAVVLVGHVVFGIVVLVLMPRGFAWSDVHAYSNTVIPGALVLLSVVALVLYLRGKTAMVAVLVCAAAGGWLAAVVTGALFFPISIHTTRLLVPVTVGLALANVAWWARPRIGFLLGALVLGGALGHVVILAQRAPLPSTRPSGGALAEVKGDKVAEEAGTGQIQERCGKDTIRLKPLITFESRSPDATWTLLAPPDAFGPKRKLERWQKTPTGFRAFYTDDGESSIIANRDKNGFEIDAVSKIPRTIYAHLVTFTTLHFSFDARLSFSATGQELFTVEPADYPTGRPLQLAYLGADLNLHVVRASDGEKGPYTEIAKGPLSRDAPLTIGIHPAHPSIHDPKDRGCSVVLKDWSSQVSTEPSPTAGWGVPQNSIQFSLKGKETFIILTLAETGPGRGWDSVGHAEGTYRNRLRTEDLR